MQNQGEWMGEENRRYRGALAPHRVVGLCRAERSCPWGCSGIPLSSPDGTSPEGLRWLASPSPSKKETSNSLPASVVRQGRDKWKTNPWSTNYWGLLSLNKGCNGWISRAKCTLHTNCIIAPFWKLLSSATHHKVAGDTKTGGMAKAPPWQAQILKIILCPVAKTQLRHGMKKKNKEIEGLYYPQTVQSIFLRITESYWKSQGKDPSNYFSSLGFILLEMPCEKRKHEAPWGCGREHLPEPNTDKNMKGTKWVWVGNFSLQIWSNSVIYTVWI